MAVQTDPLSSGLVVMIKASKLQLVSPRRSSSSSLFNDAGDDEANHSTAP